MPDQILDFWFDGLEAPGLGDFRQAWFTPSEAFDRDIRQRFLPTYVLAAAGRLGSWTTTATGALALVLVLDQFPRNMYRGTPRAFATDAAAQVIAKAALARGVDRDLSPLQRVFLYLPFEHSESMADQVISCALFEPLGHEEITFYARRHREIIERFGRFPHRNAALGRRNSAAEEAFFAEPHSRF